MLQKKKWSKGRKQRNEPIVEPAVVICHSAASAVCPKQIESHFLALSDRLPLVVPPFPLAVWRFQRVPRAVTENSLSTFFFVFRASLLSITAQFERNAAAVHGQSARLVNREEYSRFGGGERHHGARYIEIPRWSKSPRVLNCGTSLFLLSLPPSSLSLTALFGCPPRCETVYCALSFPHYQFFRFIVFPQSSQLSRYSIHVPSQFRYCLCSQLTYQRCWNWFIDSPRTCGTGQGLKAMWKPHSGSCLPHRFGIV